MRPRRMSSIASSTAANGRVVLLVCSAIAALLSKACHEPLGVASDLIHLDVDPGALGELSERRALERLGDQRDLEAAGVEGRDREADAVDGDRAVLDDVAAQVRRDLDEHPAGDAVLGDGAHHAGGVDMSLDQMAAQGVARSQGGLEVHARARDQLAERGERKRLVHHVGGELAVDKARHREAGPRDGDRVALMKVARQGGADRDAGATIRALERRDLADLSDDPGEQRHHSRRRASIRTSSPIRSDELDSGLVASPTAAAPGPANSGRPSPRITGATKTRIPSIAPASRKAPAKVAPPSSITEVRPRRPSSSRAAVTPAAPAPATEITSTPASRSAATRSPDAPGPQTATTGASSSERTSLESSGRRAPESNTTRVGWRAASTSRAVRSGSSASAVPMPTAIASDSARHSWTSRRLSGPEIHFESPAAVAVRPSRLMAAL